MGGLVVQEWIEKSGGSEKVFDAFAHAFPDADLFTLWNDDPGRFGDRPVRESWIARTPLRRRKPLALPFMPLTWSSVDLSAYEWTLASSHLFAHHLGHGGRGTRRHVYVHSPARYLWTPDLDRRGANPLVKAAAPPLRALDRRRAQASGAEVAANSAFVRDRIRAAWDVDAQVIHPPVDASVIRATASWADALTGSDAALAASLPAEFVLGASRFVPYKRLDLVIRAGDAAGVPVVLAGSGPLAEELRAQADAARVPVTIVPRPSDALLYTLYQRALAYVFPAVEDFGIMPVEAMAAGARVLVTDVGGATESVVDGVTGVHVHDWEGAGLADAVARAATLDPADSVRRSADFDAAVFERRIASWVRHDGARLDGAVA
ncbi:glycosyltransferase family 4 protein [Clavibacter michiganensis subsp. insidiosus]|nr:glycosyltransferase [Clavibacter michiganensis]AWG00575.1 glycosyl transferase [Clavibacter michiganensis subsp. insidiosus]OQJ60811.1 glycosyl transferase [Clavibacter michiganensis subsp. insidiosus]RII88081.1 glycosyltransferase family 4 protein [Clavibacter michiganensis subsp. insidiosus]RMC84236.1 glycosyltransferase family 4 protein [Clavibacter michiganensis subsp. insidiosus]